MSVTDSENNNTFNGWDQNYNLENNTDENGKNQWSGNMNNKLDKIFGSWAQAVSGDSTTFQSNNALNNLNQPDINQMDSEDNGSQNLNNQNSDTISSHLVFDDLIQSNLYSTKWGTSVINYDINWELSPSCAKEKTKGGSKNIENVKNNGTELWEANFKQNKDANFQTDSQISKAQNAIEKKDTQWKAMAASHNVGIWGEEEDLSNVWTGTPNQNTKDDANDNLYRQVNSINTNEKKTQIFNSNKNRISEKNLNWNNGEVFNYELEQKNNSENTTPSTQSIIENMDSKSFFNMSIQNTNLSNEAEKVMTDTNNVDDGTSLWGDPQGQNKVSLWKEEKSRNNNQPNNSNDSLSSSPGILRLPNSNSQNKDQWKKYQANDVPFNNNTRNNWNDVLVGLDRNNTNQTPPKNGTNWSEISNNTEDWNKKNKRKQLTKEFILSSSLFKILVDMGFKEEDVENTLRNCKMNLQESIEELRLNTLKETGAQNQQSIQQLNQNSPALNNILQKNSASIPNPDNLPSEKLLAHFVQKIQLAVQNRHLSPQILNQQLAPQTITLIYELLKQVEMRKNLKPYIDPRDYNNSANNYLTKYNKCLEKITNIEKQIKLQQAIFLKQQNLPQQLPGNRPAKPTSNLKNNDFKILTNELSNLQLNQQQNQSRLNQWKLPSFEKNKTGFQENLPNEYFSRAPGSTKQSQQFSPITNSWTGMNNENWQANILNCKDNSLSSSAPQTSSFNEYNEIITGFNANKQWKNQMQINNNEIPYAINEVEDQIYDWSNKINLVDSTANENLTKNSNNFDSSTWSFNSSLQPNNSEKNWMNDAFNNTTIWNNNSVNKSKGPPPGLGLVKNQKQSFWTNEEQNSSFLLLQKLSPQIDESTLKTLCIQHGPLQFFHLFLNFGIGLVKYNSKEEASKAQAALNNCLLGNTTISVSLASDSEVQQYLSHQATTMPDNSAIYRTNHNAIPTDNTNEYLMATENINGNLNTWNSAMPNNATNLWSFNQNNPSNLWNTMDQNNCNNSLQNLLPDNLLGESS